MDMKNKKVCLNAEAINDRISNLPDEILQHILSFVDIKEGVQTCILSKRWKYVWTHIPSLNFNLVGLANNLTKERKNSFVNFMYKVLSGRGSSDLHKFSCYIMSAIDVNFLIVFVNRALTYNSKELEITYSNIVIPPNRKPKIFLTPFEILHSWFTAKSLSVLKLTCLNEGSMFFTGTLGLITLKELHLTKIKLSDNTDNYMELISDSPNLKYLSLNECHFGELKSLKINATQLTNLEILSPDGAFGTMANPWNCNFIVSAPNLSSFKYYCHRPLVCSMGNPLNMDTVDIHITKYYTTKSNSYNKEMGRRMVAMMLEFQHAKSVTLSLRAMKILLKVPGLLHSDSPFRNMKNLKVNLKESSFLNGLNFILKNSPEAKTTLIGPSFRFNREDKAKSC